MPLTLEFNHPDFPEGTEFDVGGVLVENGGKAELTEDQERLLVARSQQPVKDYMSGSPFAKVTGTSTLKATDLSDIIVESNFGPSPEERVEAEQAPPQEEPVNE